MSRHSRSQRGWTFGLRSILVLFAIIATVLSFFYPRVYCTTIIQCPGLRQGEAFTFHRIATGEACLENATKASPEFAKLMKKKSRDWLLNKVKVSQPSDDEIEIRAIGKAIQKSSLRTIADCIAEQIVEIQSSKITELQSEVRELVETAKADLDSQLEKESNPVVRRRQERLRVVVDERLETMEATFVKENAKLPKIVGRSSGFDFQVR